MKKTSTVAAKPNKKISPEKLTVGLDLGDRNSWYCVLDESGQIQLEHCSQQLIKNGIVPHPRATRYLPSPPPKGCNSGGTAKWRLVIRSQYC